MADKNTYPGDYTIPFSGDLSEDISCGDKYVTYRYGYKYAYLDKGDKVDLIEYDTKSLIRKAKVKNIHECTFEDLPLTRDGHESYASKKEQRDTFNKYYRYLGRDIKDDDPFIIIEFDLV